MKLTERQKNLIRHELSGKPNTVLYFIKRDIQEHIWNLDLDDEDIESLRKMWEFFHCQDYDVVDEEIDDIIFAFERDIVCIWDVIRNGLCHESSLSDIEFDKEGIINEIDEAVKEYLITLEEN